MNTIQAFFIEFCIFLSLKLFFFLIFLFYVCTVMAKQQTSVRNRTNVDLREPRRYKVIIYNDDFTTMEFVVHILNSIFYESPSEAESLMLDVHERGSAVVGVYSYDIATSRVRKATMLAREQNFPLRLECKPE